MKLDPAPRPAPRPAPLAAPLADALLERLMDGFDGLSADEAHALAMRLVLLLAHHIGDEAVIANSVAMALEPERNT